MAVCVRQQRDIACALNSFRQLALIARFSASDTARNNLAALRHIAFQSVQIFVIDLSGALAVKRQNFLRRTNLAMIILLYPLLQGQLLQRLGLQQLQLRLQRP